MNAVTVTPRDRLGFSLFLALSVHAALILGVGFDWQDPADPAPTIEVTLATHEDAETPDDADFIAQANQQGSGTEDEALETTTDTAAEIFDNQLNELIPEPMPPIPETSREVVAEVTAMRDSDESASTDARLDQIEHLSLADNTDKTYEELAHEIASLEARLAQEAQTSAKRPRVKRLTSVSTKSAAEAAYLNSWRQRVERIGNANFPGGGVYGNLRMLVVVGHDGDLKQVEILQSSGVKRLDDAALRIVRLAAPFPDFPPDMKKRYDQLEIIRTWRFSRAGASLGA